MLSSTCIIKIKTDFLNVNLSVEVGLITEFLRNNPPFDTDR